MDTAHTIVRAFLEILKIACFLHKNEKCVQYDVKEEMNRYLCKKIQNKKGYQEINEHHNKNRTSRKMLRIKKKITFRNTVH